MKVQNSRPKTNPTAIKLGLIVAALCGLLGFTILKAKAASEPHWEIKGQMSEACTCSVPCSCNFASRPSHAYCWSIASFEIQKGRYGRVRLNGLHLVRGHGSAAIVWYIDERSSPTQFAALESIAAHISGSLRGHPPLHFERAHIVQEVGNRGNEVEVSGAGGFRSDDLIGNDGKNPIVVENMTSWNVRDDIKGRTRWLRYQDQYGDKFDLKDTSSNQGKFDWTDKTRVYF